MTDHIEQYKAYLQDVGNIGVRHENSRKFYLSVVSALFVFISMAGEKGIFANVQGHVLTLAGLVGILLCIVWVMHMQAFGAIYRAKFDVLRKIESKHSLFHIFDEEWKFLKANPRFKLLTFIDSVTPILFLIVFITLMYLK
ncbi:MAG: hypothetical protein KAT04_11270 [Methylococcales bacterium]|nr:hypothetical protein [Methylococcales bacterium]